jgi:nucleoside-diphosphate-sugar epimerase
VKIFITGSTGFVGKNLIKYYSHEEVKPYYRENDLSFELENFKPDVIINSAAEIYDDSVMWESNVVLTKKCLDYVKNNPTTKMVQIGSSSEYGPMPRASSEKDLINPVDMYQATKGMCTLLAQGYARHYNLDIVIARPYSVYGPGEKPHRLFPRLYNAYIKQEPMVLYQGFHDFIYIDDFVRGIDILCKYENAPKGDIVNFGSGVQYSNFEINDIFQKITNVSAPVEKKLNLLKPFESNFWVCDTTYAWQKYKFKTQYDIYAGIKDFIDLSI